jgi:hypothetical protein
MTFIDGTHRVLLSFLSGATLMAASTLAPAQDQFIVLEPERATTYLNGGIGQDEEQYMRKVAKDWSLRLTFSEAKDDEFVANVGLLVTDLRGTPYLQLSGAGPMTYARLPAGKYRVTARFKGQSETHEVTLDGKVGRDVNFHWKAPAQ